MGAATVAVGWSGYFVSLLGSFGIHIPPQWAEATGQAVKLADGTTATAICNLPAVLIVLVLTALLMFGTKESTRVNNIMVAFKLFVVGVVIVVGAFYVNRAQLDAVHPRKHRHVRQLRLQRHPARRLGRVLRLYRLRRRLHRGAGGEAAAAGHAHRHPRFADRSAPSSMC